MRWPAASRTLAGLRSTAAAHPARWDCLLALALYLLLTFAVTTHGELTRAHGELIGAAANLVLVGPLAWRRRSPLAVLAVVAAASALSLLVLAGTGGEAAVLVALGTVAAREPDRVRAVAAIAATVIAAIVVVLVYGPERTAEALAGVLAALTAAIAVGLAIRARRAQLVAQGDRAERLAREREQETELAVAAERARIARDLHDIVAHNVSVMVALADGAEAAGPGAPPPVREAVGQIARTGREALEELRGLLGVLHDSSAAPGSLGPQPGLKQLDELLAGVRGAGLQARLRIEGEPVAVGSVTQLTVYRIVQEALTNVLRHAREATVAEVRLRFGCDQLDLEILDDGLPVPEVRGSGRGLAGMRERAVVHGAGVRAGPGDPAGWRVATSIPLPGRGPGR